MKNLLAASALVAAASSLVGSQPRVVDAQFAPKWKHPREVEKHKQTLAAKLAAKKVKRDMQRKSRRKNRDK